MVDAVASTATKEVLAPSFRAVLRAHAVRLLAHEAYLLGATSWIQSTFQGASWLAAGHTVLRLPRIAFSLLGGAASDRWGTRVGLGAADLGAGLILTCVAAAQHGVGLPPVVGALVVLFVVSSAAAWAAPIVQASVSRFLPESGRDKGNAWVTALDLGAKVSGPAVGALVFAKYGLDALLMLCAVAFLWAGVSELRNLAPDRPRSANRGEHQSLSGVFSYVRMRPELSSVILGVGLINLFFGPLMAFLPRLAVEAYGWSAEAHAWLLGAFFVGMIAGNAHATRAGTLLRSPRKVAALLYVQAILLALLGFVPGTIGVMLMFFVGAANGPSSLAMIAGLQTHSDNSARGSVLGLFLSTSPLLTPISIWGTAMLFDQKGYSLPSVYAGLGIGGMVAVALLARSIGFKRCIA